MILQQKFHNLTVLNDHIKIPYQENADMKHFLTDWKIDYD